MAKDGRSQRRLLEPGPVVVEVEAVFSPNLWIDVGIDQGYGHVGASAKPAHHELKPRVPRR